MTASLTLTCAVQELATGKMALKAGIPNTTGTVVWAADNRTLFYVTQDEKHRAHAVWRHALGTDPSTDVKVFQEDDELFGVGVWRARDDSHIFIQSASSITSETRCVCADSPHDAFTVCPLHCALCKLHLTTAGCSFVCQVR